MLTYFSELWPYITFGQRIEILVIFVLWLLCFISAISLFFVDMHNDWRNAWSRSRFVRWFL